MAIIEIKVPAIGESITEVTLGKWLKNDGDIVAVDDPICEFESDKANMELPAEVAGKLTLIAKEGDDLAIGSVIASIDTDAAGQSGSSKPAKSTPDTTKEKPVDTVQKAAVSTETYASGHPSPAAAKLMSERNISASEISGTGRDGRITKEDVMKVGADKSVAVVPETTTASQDTKTALAFSRSIRREKMSRMRRTIATRLVSAKNNTAMLTTFNEVDLTEVMALRDKYQDRFVAKYGIKLGFMSLFAKACAQALMEMPEVNAMIDGNDIIYHDYADISIAISTPSGLVVPPVHNVESLNFAEIEKEIKKLADKARAGKLTLEEMSGGTFTITNGGVFGSMMSTPIINEPQSAILGMHAIQQRPMAINGEVKIRPMMYLALSYDHRIIDGSSSVTFLVKVKKFLEDPMTLLMGI